MTLVGLLGGIVAYCCGKIREVQATSIRARIVTKMALEST